jgi:cytochrome c-type biogenesis protein CcmH
MRRLALLLLLALALPGGALAAEPKTTLPAIEEQVMCVVCNTPLSVAGGPQADAQRREIRRLIAQGKTEQQIKDALVAEYGERVLALPDDEGFELAAYLVPIAALAGALALLAVLLPRWRRSARTRGGPAALGPPLSDEDARRLDEDLARYD